MGHFPVLVSGPRKEKKGLPETENCEVPWTHGSVDSWIRFVFPWAHHGPGFVEPWAYGSVHPWIPGYVDLWARGPMDQWSLGLVGSCPRGSMKSWTCATMDLRAVLASIRQNAPVFAIFVITRNAHQHPRCSPIFAILDPWIREPKDP